MRKMMMLTALLGLTGFWAGAEALNLEEARTRALANSRSLARYVLSAQSAALDEKAQSYTMMPSLSLGASASLNLWGEQRLPEGGAGVSGAAIGDSFGAGLSLGISQKIWDGGKNGVLKVINGLSAEITRKEALAEYYAVLDQADTAYFALLQAGAALDAAEASLETAALALSIAELRVETGMASYGDYLQALADKESRETSRNQARREVTLGQAKLASLTGVRNPEPEAIDFARYEEIIQRLASLDDRNIEERYRAFLAAAGARNPALIKAGLLTRQAEEAVTLAKRDYMPTLNAGISTGLNYGVLNGWSLSGGRVSLTGSIPLDFWVIGNGVAKKRLAQEEAHLNYRTAETTLELDIQTALLDTINQAGLVLSARRAQEYANRHLEYAQERFSLSQSSITDLFDAAALVSTNQNQLIKAQYGFLAAISRLRSLGGFEDDREVSEVLRGTP